MLSIIVELQLLTVFGRFLFLAIAILVAILYFRWKLVYRTFSNLGIPGPTPQLYYGNAKEISKKGILKFFKEYTLKFGHVYGYFNGMTQLLVVSDLEIVRQVGIKQFDIFMDRQRLPNVLHPKESSNITGLFSSEGEDWKRKRKILSKSFNTLNMNRMSPLIEGPCTSLRNKLDELSSQKSVNMFQLYSLYTMEVILSTGFGHKVNVIEGGEDELTRACAGVFAAFREGSEMSSISTMLSNFPFMISLIHNITSRSKPAQDSETVENNVRKLLKKRLQNVECSDKVPQDLLQLLIDARADDDEVDIQHKKLSDMEIVRVGFSLLLAGWFTVSCVVHSGSLCKTGYETTSNALGYTTYLLALHPEEQDKLYQEINQYYHNHPNATLTEVAQSIPYLDMVIQESLRLYPPAPRFVRHCSATVNINGVTIPKGCNVEVPVYMIHRSPEHWSEPEEFNPNRFTKEEKEKRHPLAHMPFGLGPRSCIGMRLALLEAKMALTSLLYNYEFIESPDTEKPLSLHCGITMIPKNGVWVHVRKRRV